MTTPVPQQANFGSRYRVDRKLGAGGMAEVFLVHHKELGTTHALKVLRVAAPSMQMRLLQEGKMQARLRHPNVVAVTDIVRLQSGIPALIMDFVDGPALDIALARFRPSFEQIDVLARGILSGLIAAHQCDLVHRDLKPENILLALDGDAIVPRIADFGLAKHLFRKVTTSTRSGMAMGTPKYMAPEQFRDAKSVDHRADIYSMGVILYELVTGKKMITEDDFIAAYQKVSKAEYRKIRDIRPDAPERMVRAIEAALAVAPDNRVQTATELLELWTDREPAPDARWQKGQIAVLSKSKLSTDNKSNSEQATRMMDGGLGQRSSSGAHTEIPWLGSGEVSSVAFESANPLTSIRPTDDELNDGAPENDFWETTLPEPGVPDLPKRRPRRSRPMPVHSMHPEIPPPAQASTAQRLLFLTAMLLMFNLALGSAFLVGWLAQWGQGTPAVAATLGPPPVVAPVQPAPEPAPAPVPRVPTVPEDWIRIEAGSRTMGNARERVATSLLALEYNWSGRTVGGKNPGYPWISSAPVHDVVLEEADLAPEPLTWEEWGVLGGDDGGKTGPVTGLPPKEIVRVLNRASSDIGLEPALADDLSWTGGNGFRLPTEAEWEAALGASPPAHLESVTNPEATPKIPGRRAPRHVLRGGDSTQRHFRWSWDKRATFRLARSR